jgi:ubiquinone/menaquinone biosynthesis C-methylase UbiE
MADPYAAIAQTDPFVQQRLADVLELRAADPQQQMMIRAYLSEISLPKGARALEIGCGTGAVSRAVVELLKIEVLGVDPSPVFVARARELGHHLKGLTFAEDDGRSLDLPDASFDLVMFHTALSHIPEPELVLREAYRVLRPEGWLTVFEGDYTTTSVAISEFDPLQPLVDAMVASFVQNRWLTRRIPRTLAAAGFAVQSHRAFGYVQTAEPAYMLTIIDRGADLLAATGTLTAQSAEALRMEARRRARDGEFFGHMSFVSAIARKAGIPGV